MTTTRRPNLRPDDPDGALYDSVMGGAWLAFIRWAFTEPGARAAFTKATGIPFETGDSDGL